MFFFDQFQKTTFFIGNGINRAIKGEGVSWDALLTKLQNSFNAQHIDLTNEFKPFPLSFEEILFSAKGPFDENIRIIKGNIALAFFDSKPNYLHEMIVNSGIANIITTNYDYNFEKAILKDFNNEETPLEKRTLETKLSINRRCYIHNPNTKAPISIWHIHGEINHNIKFKPSHYNSESILIGYDHYVESLSEIQVYLRGTKYKGQPKISDKLKRNIQGLSWIDKFFTDRLIIIGFEFDFSEIDLWWLLNFRMKTFKRHKELIKNEIIYYQPIIENIQTNSENIENEGIFKQKKRCAIKDVLISLGVNYKEIKCKNREEFYKNVFDKENIKKTSK
jgi:hypothetical protein